MRLVGPFSASSGRAKVGKYNRFIPTGFAGSMARLPPNKLRARLSLLLLIQAVAAPILAGVLVLLTAGDVMSFSGAVLIALAVFAVLVLGYVLLIFALRRWIFPSTTSLGQIGMPVAGDDDTERQGEGAAVRPEQSILMTLVEALRASQGSLWLLAEDGVRYTGRARIAPGSGPLPSSSERQLMAESEPLIEAMARTRRPQLIPDAGDPADGAQLGGGHISELGYSALLAVPLLQGEMLVGFVLLDAKRDRGGYSLADLALAETAGRLAAMILHAPRHQRLSLRQNQRMTALANLAAALTAQHQLEDLLQQMVEQGRGLAQSISCAVLLLDEEDGQLELLAQAGLGDDLPEVRLPLTNSIVHEFIASGRPLIVEDIDRDLPELRQFLLQTDLHAIDIYPLRIGGRTIGALTLGYPSSHLRYPDVAGVGEALASVAAAAIQNARAFEVEAEQQGLLRTVAEISRRVSGILDTDQMLLEVCNLLGEEFGFDYVHIFLRSAKGDRLGYAAGAGTLGQDIGAQSLALPIGDDSLVGRVAASEAARRADDGEADEFRRVHPDLRAVESEIGIPIIAHEQVMGVLLVQSKRSRTFDPEDEQLLRIVADQVAVALDNARHHAEVRRQARLDSLTQVLNHGAFVAEVHNHAEKAASSGDSLSLIMLDVDNFKAYNDRFGHVAGDAALRTTVQAIRSHVKSRDAIGRWGGEEFGIILVGATKEQAGLVADRIQTTLASLTPIDELGRKMPAPTVSQGIATFGEDAKDANELVDIADRMLYRAKEGGRNQVQIAGAA